MTTLTYAVRDSSTMLRRNLKRMLRYPSMTLMLVGIPVIFLLLFVYIFGGTLGNGLGGAGGGRQAYANYVLPGVLLITVAGIAQGTAISVAMDMTEGIIARFRTMAIARVSILTGHVIGNMIQTLLAVSTLSVTRPHTTENQMTAKVIITSTPAAASHSTGVALGRKPTSSATARTTVSCARICSTLPST